MAENIQWRALGTHEAGHSYSAQAASEERLLALMAARPEVQFTKVQKCRLAPDATFFNLPNWTVLEERDA